MNIQVFVCNPFGENTYVVFDETRSAVIIDPGFYDEQELQLAKDFVAEQNLKVCRILNTHLHLDHCIGNGLAVRAWNVPVGVGEPDLPLLQGASMQAAMFGLRLDEELPLPTEFLREGDVVKVGNMEISVLEVPGHSAGSLAFYEKSAGAVFAGDVLFQGSYGRTDLPGGSFGKLMHSIKEKLFALPGNTTVLCGHGPATTIGQERENFI